jgi:uncharacterized protein YcbK (DUF882 family)
MSHPEPATAGGPPAAGPDHVLEQADHVLEQTEHALAEAADALAVALHFPRWRSTRWHWSGLSPRGERWFNLAATLLLLVFVASWAWSITDLHARGVAGRERDGLSSTTARIAAGLTEPDAPTASYLTDAALGALAPRGASGRLRAVIVDPGAEVALDSLPAGAAVAYRDHGVVVADSAIDGEAARAPTRSGIWQVALSVGKALRPVGEFSVITRRPISDRRNGRVGLYFIGTWPTERAARKGYRTPSGFVEVTPENQDTQVSEHFQLRDFLTKGQADVWPKYLVLDMKLVDKLELVLAELRERGVDTRGVTVMSGFRTPQYNATGGNTAGRASLSRHMYGDASDVFIDNDGDGWMDDLNGDGRRDVADARVVAAAAERVEAEHPSLIGGVGIYRPGPGHGPFVHIDTRGYRARW